MKGWHDDGHARLNGKLGWRSREDHQELRTRIDMLRVPRASPTQPVPPLPTDSVDTTQR